MNDGRSRNSGHVIPLATAVAEAKYCFQSANAGHSENERLKLLCAGREHCLSNYHVSRTDFACTVVEFVVEGKGTLQVGNNVFDLFPGMIFSYGMNSPHDLWADPADPMTKYFTAFLDPTKTTSRQNIGILPGEIRWTRDLAAIQTLFEELIREGQRSGKLHEEITSRYLELILLKAREAASPGHNQVAKTGESYERSLACIESHFAELNTLEDLGQRVGLEANYLCRLFRRFGHETPMRCITRHKLNRAAELLLAYKDPVKQVAYDVGYEDPYYFSRIFRKRFGCSPREFRLAIKHAVPSES